MVPSILTFGSHLSHSIPTVWSFSSFSSYFFSQFQFQFASMNLFGWTKNPNLSPVQASPATLQMINWDPNRSHPRQVFDSSFLISCHHTNPIMFFSFLFLIFFCYLCYSTCSILFVPLIYVLQLFHAIPRRQWKPCHSLQRLRRMSTSNWTEGTPTKP